MQDICEHIARANRLFIFGTGEAQNAAAQIIKRMFMYAKRFFVTLAGASELTMALEDLEPEDFMIGGEGGQKGESQRRVFAVLNGTS